MADGMTAGTTGKGKRMEAVRIKSQHCGNVYAKAHIQDVEWSVWTDADGVSTLGTVG